MANRWPPWIEARVSSTGAINPTVVAPAPVPGCTLTVTPKINCRVAIVSSWDVEVAVAAGVFIGELYVNTVAKAQQALLGGAAVGFRATLGQSWTHDLTAGTAYTFELKGSDTVGNSYVVHSTHTGFVIFGLPSDGFSY